MAVLGLVLLILGLIFAVPLLFWIGVALLVVGGVLLAMSYSGREVGGRRWY